MFPLFSYILELTISHILHRKHINVFIFINTFLDLQLNKTKLLDQIDKLFDLIYRYKCGALHNRPISHDVKASQFGRQNKTNWISWELEPIFMSS